MYCGEGFDGFWLDDIKCTGIEHTLEECRHGE